MKVGGSSKRANFCERADKTTRILDVRYETLPARGAPKSVSQTESLEWSAVCVRAARGTPTNPFTARTCIRALVAEFLLLNDDFPRSLRFCVGELNYAVRQISGAAEGNFRNDTEKLAGRFLAELQFGTIDEIFDYGLHQYLDDAQVEVQQHRRRALQRLHFPAVPKLGRRIHGSTGGTTAAVR